jgi:hypothetical protein
MKKLLLLLQLSVFAFAANASPLGKLDGVANAVFTKFDKDNSNSVDMQEWEESNLFTFDHYMDLNKDGVATPVTEWKNWQ